MTMSGYVLGYLASVFYLTSRFPQICKNVSVQCCCFLVYWSSVRLCVHCVFYSKEKWRGSVCDFSVRLVNMKDSSCLSRRVSRASETRQPNNWSSCLWRPWIYCRRKPTLSHDLTALKELSLTLCHVMERCVELWPPYRQDTHAPCPCYLQCVFLQCSYTLWSSC